MRLDLFVQLKNKLSTMCIY